MNVFGDFIDRYLAWAGMLALTVAVITNFTTISNGLGTLTRNTGDFVSAFKGNG